MLIVFEGIDGAGKTTLAHAVKLALESLGLKAIVTSEFGRADAWSVEGKKQLMAARNQREEYNAVMLTRLAHQGDVLNRTPDTTIILMDRFLPSTIAYQGCQTIPPSIMISDHASQHLPVPDLTILLELNPAVAHERAKHRGDRDKFDTRNVDHYAETQRRFWTAMDLLKGQGWESISLSGDLPMVRNAEACVAAIMERVRKASEGAAA